jgi:hypothetical protein
MCHVNSIHAQHPAGLARASDAGRGQLRAAFGSIVCRGRDRLKTDCHAAPRICLRRDPHTAVQLAATLHASVFRIRRQWTGAFAFALLDRGVVARIANIKLFGVREAGPTLATTRIMRFFVDEPRGHCGDCIDAHAHLGSLEFDRSPQRAIVHYEIGLRIKLQHGVPEPLRQPQYTAC